MGGALIVLFGYFFHRESRKQLGGMLAAVVIMLTAVRDERERQLALSLGAIAVVSKPFIVQDLVQLVEKHAARE